LFRADEKHRVDRIRLEEKLKDRREHYEYQIESYSEEIKEILKFEDLMAFPQYMEKIDKYSEILAGLEEEMDMINDEERKMFGFNTTFDTFLKMKALFIPHNDMWRAIAIFQKKKKEWKESSLRNIDPTEVDSLIKQNIRTLQKVAKVFEKKPTALLVCQKFKKDLEELSKMLPTIEVLCNPGKLYFLSL
jgi:dynein heavy chain, axonemal